MAETKADEKTVLTVLTGCFGAGWQLFVTAPLFLFLMFALMRANEMPTWAWVCFWVYVPAHVMGCMITAIFKTMADFKE